MTEEEQMGVGFFRTEGRRELTEFVLANRKGIIA